MVEHDAHVGQLLKNLDDLGIADNTIVVYTSDNGAEVMTWPDGGNTPFRGEKATNWEGGYRVPTCIRWPGLIKPGTIINDFFFHEDLIPAIPRKRWISETDRFEEPFLMWITPA
jgi:arylsulfatase A-like enzyme